MLALRVLGIQQEPVFCPGITTMGGVGVTPDGGPQEGVSGEMGKYPGESLEPLPGGGPQGGVSGEMGANPGESLEPLPDGGPQEGVFGEIGAYPGELSADDCPEEFWEVSGD